MRTLILLIMVLFTPLAIGASAGARFTSFGGFRLGIGTLADVRAVLGPAKMIESGEAGEYEVRLCYRTKQATVTYLSGEMGGPNHDLLGVSVGATSGPDMIDCPQWPAARREPLPYLAGLTLGMSKNAFKRVVGVDVKQDGDVSRAFFLSRRDFTHTDLTAMPQDVRNLVAGGGSQNCLDVQISVEAYFADDRLTLFKVWKVETR
ncbi:MAG: hypothetical protein KGJ96_06450 [Xanthomonadaceae bacterium]|nr:hypothetical protein [Xanthomonadaceae bacterium]MDE2248201.1 hypothetical protein [Xanthomonadaceae bacterium]